MSWQLRIYDPSGETRLQCLRETQKLGRHENSNIVLRDPTVAPIAGILSQNPFDLLTAESSPYWLHIPEDSPPALLGDLQVREAHIPIGISFKIGETKLLLESQTQELILPPVPLGVKSWLTISRLGQKLLWMAKKAAETQLSTYLAGETGTGKEVLAYLIHAWSPRRTGPFIPLHCGALPLSLAESELFGHVKGAFTGAVQQRSGALMQAHGGTLFLDEVGDLPLDIQVKLLRFLENGEIRAVGADRIYSTDVRLICATHHCLKKRVEEGKFRQDLYYRLASITLDIPSLRSRPEDIGMLAYKFTSELGKSLTPKALLRLKAHNWPGNVRELQHAIERACGLAGAFQPILSEEAFDFLLTLGNVAQTPELELGSPFLSLKEMERILLLKALRLTNGNRTEAAKALGVARSTLFEMLKRHHIFGPKSKIPLVNELKPIEPKSVVSPETDAA